MKNKVILLFCLFIVVSSCKSLNAVEIGDNFPVDTGWNAFIGDSNTEEKDFKVCFSLRKNITRCGIFL